MDKNRYIDYNIDLIEIAKNIGTKEIDSVIDKVSSVNISSCNRNISPIDIKKAMQLCKFKHKVVGANIFLPDSVEKPLELSEEDIEAIVLYQLGAISAFATSESMNIEYVRPQGIMNELFVEDYEFAIKVANAVKKFNKWFLLYGPTCENLVKVGESIGINTVQEVCLYRHYKQGAVIDFNNDSALEYGAQLIRLRRLMNLSEIETEEGVYSKITFDSISFDASDLKLVELLNEANCIVLPRPVNFNNAAASGWVE